MNIYILTIFKQADDYYYPDYKYIHGIYSTREKAEEAAMNLQHKHEALHSAFYDFSGWEITKYAVNSDDDSAEVINKYYRK